MKIDMSQPRTCRQPPGLKGSVHLTAEENETLSLAVCDRKWEVLALGIAEVYRSGPPHRHDRWCRSCCGVVCFIKDNAARAFFIRVFDFDRNEFAWEQELFLEFSYNAQVPYFHTFEADDCQAGLNFAFEEEASAFKRAVEEKLRSRQKKREEKRRNQAVRGGGPVPRHDPQIPMGPSTNGISSVSKKQTSGGKKSKKQKERKYTKADISCPTDFVHVQHVGWHPEKGFDFQNYVEETELTRFFEMAMVTEKDLKEPSTRAFIYEFIERNGGVDVIKEGVSKTESKAAPTPPPIPTREPAHHHPRTHPQAPAPPTSGANGVGHRIVPPPPPARTGPNRAPAAPLSNGRTIAPPPRGGAFSPAAPPPPPPPPPSGGARLGGAPPPPPPPPMGGPINGSVPSPPAAPRAEPGGGGAGADPKAALLEQIRKGKALNHVDPETESTHSTNSNPDSRGALLDQIRGGITLKAVPDTPKPAPADNKLEGLAGALARALQERARACLHDSDSSDDSDSEEDEWED